MSEDPGGSTQAPGGPDVVPKREELLGLVDAELQVIAAERAREGTTRWGIYVALAALVWALLAILKNKDTLPAIGVLAHAFVALTVAIDALGAVRLALGGEIANKASTRFAPIVSQLARPAVAWGAASCAAVAVAAWASSAVPWFPRVVAVASYGLAMVLLVGILLMSFRSVIMPVDGGGVERKTYSTLRVVVPIVLGYCAYAFVHGLWSDWRALRVAALLVGVQYVVRALAAHGVSRELEQALSTARRDLVIGGGDARDVAVRVDVALLGLRASDVLSREAVACTNAVEEADRQIAALDRWADGFAELAREPTRERFSDAVADFERVADTAGKAVDSVRERTRELKAKTSSLLNRTRGGAAHTALQNEIAGVLDAMEFFTARATTQLEALRAKIAAATAIGIKAIERHEAEGAAGGETT